MFDWLGFLNRHHIEHKEEHRRKVISIRCPMCGDDPSMHMGISMEGRGWHCWRNEIAHTGRSPVRLIAALLNCTFEQAAALAHSEVSSFATTDETFASDVLSVLGVQHQRQQKQRFIGTLEFLDEFSPVERRGACKELVYPYLEGRGYTPDDVDELAERFLLKYSLSGRFAYRVVVPVFMRKKLVNWTGRSVSKQDTLRYRSLSDDPVKARADGLPCAPMNIKDCLFDYDEILKGGKTLVAVEGPFDAMRLSFFGRDYGLKATAFFNTSPRPAQIGLLIALAELYDNFFGVYDAGAEFQMFRNIPSYLDFTPKYLPRKFKDPAELDFRGFRDLFEL